MNDTNKIVDGNTKKGYNSPEGRLLQQMVGRGRRGTMGPGKTIITKPFTQAPQPRDTQIEQSVILAELFEQMIEVGSSGKLQMPIGFGKTMVVMLAANILVAKNINIVYASTHIAMVEQMREYGPDFRTMTFREFNDVDLENDPVDVVLYDGFTSVSFGEGILGIQL